MVATYFSGTHFPITVLGITASDFKRGVPNPVIFPHGDLGEIFFAPKKNEQDWGWVVGHSGIAKIPDTNVSALHLWEQSGELNFASHEGSSKIPWGFLKGHLRGR